MPPPPSYACVPPADAVAPLRRRTLRGGPALLAIGIAAALALGVAGLAQAYAGAGITTTPARLLTEALALIVGRLPAPLVDRALPLALTCARVLLPALVGGGVAALAWRMIRNPVRLRRVRWLGEHLVIAGDDGLARRVATAELARGRRVLVWHDDPAARWIRDLVRGGAALATRTHATDGIDSLALGRARAVLLVGPDDPANLALATDLVIAARDLRAPGEPLDVIVRVDDLARRRAAEPAFDRPATTTACAARLRFASLPDLAARQLFIAAPLDSFRRIGTTSRTVLLLGFTAAIEHYVLRLLAGSHFRDGIRPRFVVVVPDVATCAADFAGRNPHADALSPLLFDAAPSGDLAMASIADLVARHGEPAAIVIDAGDDGRSATIAHAAAHHYAALDRTPPPIHVHLSTAHDVAPETLLHVFGTHEHFSDPELLLQEDHDSLARSIHDFYLQGRFDDGEKVGTRASMHEWEDLPERFRDDNRMVADCYALKLRDIGARVVAGDGAPMWIEPDELEELSRAEHDRWMGAKLKDGWRFAATRDDAARLHPDILPYDALSERIKDLDREQVRAITRLLSVSGRRALRTLTIAIDPLTDSDPRVALQSVAAAQAIHYPDRVTFYAGDPATRALPYLVAAHARGMPVLLTQAGHPAPLLDSLEVAARAAATRLLTHADTRIAATDAAAASAWLHATADLWLTTQPSRGDPRDIVIDRQGAIIAAPWTR